MNRQQLRIKRKKEKRIKKILKNIVIAFGLFLLIVSISLSIVLMNKNKEIKKLKSEVFTEKDKRQSIAELCHEAMSIANFKFQWAVQQNLTEAYKYMDRQVQIDKELEELSK